MTKFDQYIKENHPDPDWLMENKEVYDEMVRLGDSFKNEIQ